MGNKVHLVSINSLSIIPTHKLDVPAHLIEEAELTFLTPPTQEGRWG